MKKTIRRARRPKKSTDECTKPIEMGDFNQEYLNFGQWPVPCVQTFNRLKTELKGHYSAWLLSQQRATMLESTLSQLRREKSRTEEIQKQYSETKLALKEALGVCAMLASQISSIKAGRSQVHRRTNSNL